jgi:prevent-host-death family protein
MAHFSLTDLSNRSGEVVEAAFRGPVEITRHGKRKFMLLTAEDYDRLVRAADKRRVSRRRRPGAGRRDDAGRPDAGR